MLIKIGSLSILERLPKLIEVQGKPFILTKSENGDLFLYSAICPHQHGVVEELGKDVWRCPSHGWTFDPVTGRSINSPLSSLQRFGVTQDKDDLFADLPLDTREKITTPHTAKGPKITLVSNACLLIEWKGFRILTDPWMEGPAFFGSWTQYPPSGIKVKDLPPIDLIWISHEHTDHLNPHTLSLFDKKIPLLVPKLRNARLVSILKKLGFQNLSEMPSYQLFSIRDDIQLMSFKSGSVWNDSILYMRFGNFSILNFNDAGYNANIKNVIDKVDLICTAYSQGASGYPMTWTHIDDETKIKIMKEGNIGMLKMVKQMVDMFKPRYVIPFAAFNELYQPSHFRYERLRTKNSLKSVVDYLKDTPVQVLDMIPGESWNGEIGKIERRADRDKFFDEKFLYSYLKKTYDAEKNMGFMPSDFDLSHEEIAKYFTAFSNSDVSHKIGNMRICFSAVGDSRQLNGLIIFKDGIITHQSLDGVVEAEMTITCPGWLAHEIIRKDLSWDEAHVGYWCIFSRNPDVYNIYLWQLLHAPWEARDDSNTKIFHLRPISLDTSIADLIEKEGILLTNILEKYGLYCAGCFISVGETIEDGCRMHGIDSATTKDLLEEIKHAIDMKYTK